MARKIKPLKIRYVYANAPDSQERIDQFYNWLVNKAIDELLAEQKKKVSIK